MQADAAIGGGSARYASCKLQHRGQDLIAQLGRTRIDVENAVFPNRKGQVRPVDHHHVDIALHGKNVNLSLRGAILRRASGLRARNLGSKCGQSKYSLHA